MTIPARPVVPEGPVEKVYLDGTRQWRLRRICHRDDLPAVINADGTFEHWTHGVRTFPDDE